MMACDICGDTGHQADVYEQRDGCGNVQAIVDTCPSPQVGPPLPFDLREFPRPASVNKTVWLGSLFELWNHTPGVRS